MSHPTEERGLTISPSNIFLSFLKSLNRGAHCPTEVRMNDGENVANGLRLKKKRDIVFSGMKCKMPFKRQLGYLSRSSEQRHAESSPQFTACKANVRLFKDGGV